MDKCNIVELAAVMINPRTLTIIEGSEFCCIVKPPFSLKPADDIVRFHCKANMCTGEQMLEKWELALPIHDAFPQFMDYLSKYHTRTDRQSKFTAPIAAGHNILKFDLPILNRVHKELGITKPMFHPRDQIDLINMLWPWFENNDEVNSLALDNLREYFGMKKDGAHTGIADVRQEAELLIRLLKLYRKSASKVKFKGAFNGT